MYTKRVCHVCFFGYLGSVLLGLSKDAKYSWFAIKIVFTLILEVIFITFIVYFILKLYIFINVFIQNLANIFMSCIYSLRFYWYLYFTVLCFFVIIFLICIFVNLLHIFRNFVNLFYILSSRSSVNVEKDITHTISLHLNCG